jgi:hypothetical protein
LELPRELAAGAYELRAEVRFGEGEVQTDSFTVHIMAPPAALPGGATFAVFDPKGETAAWLKTLGVTFRTIGADLDPAAGEILVIGRHALTVDGPGPDLTRVRDGLRAIVFEQASNVLERRLGFRTTEYGLRQVFGRVFDHPVLAGVQPEHLRDWQGEATTTTPRLSYEMAPQHGPTVRWCDIPVSRVWRCGNRGNVASVLIEKPARGDFRPLLDGGYGLQYSPLMEFREGKGVVLFCQMDVTGRTEADPAAQALAANLLRYAAAWKAELVRRVVYTGEPGGRKHLEAAGVAVAEYANGDLSPDAQVLVVGAGGGKALAEHAAEIRTFVEGGGRVLAVGVDQADLDAGLPVKVPLHRAEHINAAFDAAPMSSPLAGVGPADVHNRDPRDVPLITSGAGARVLGDGVLAVADVGDKGGGIVFCQLAPWQFDPQQAPNLKRTFRRTSFLLNRLMGNAGGAGATPILDRFKSMPRLNDKRWLEGLYLDVPTEWDDPYRFFRW